MLSNDLKKSYIPIISVTQQSDLSLLRAIFLIYSQILIKSISTHLNLTLLFKKKLKLFPMQFFSFFNVAAYLVIYAFEGIKGYILFVI